MCFALFAVITWTTPIPVQWTANNTLAYSYFALVFTFFFVILLFFLSHHGSTGVISWILILVIPPFHIKEDVDSCVGIIDLCLLCSSNGKIVCGMIYVPYYCMLGKKSSFVFLHLAAHKGGNKSKVFTSPFATFEVQGSSYRKSLCILIKKKKKKTSKKVRHRKSEVLWNISTFYLEVTLYRR